MTGLEAQAFPANVTGQFFNFMFSCLDGARLETAIVAIILTFFFLLKTPRMPKCKPEDCSVTCRRKCRPAKGKIGGISNLQGTLGKGADADQVQKWISSLLVKGCRAHAGMFKEYESLVWYQGVALNQYITDFQQARALYASLVAASLKMHKFQVEDTAGGKQRPRSWTPRLLSDMRTFAFPRSLEFYGLVTKLLMQERLYQDVLTLYKEMQVDQIEPDSGLYTCLLNCAVEIHDQRVHNFFDKLCQLRSLSLKTSMVMLRAYAQQKDWQGAVQMLEKMHASGNAPDSLVLNHVVALCVTVGKTGVAESLLLKYADLVDVITCNTILKGYAHQADLPTAEALLERMLATGPAPNVITFNTVMDCAVRMIHKWDTASKHSRGDSRGKDVGPRSMPTSTLPSIRTMSHRPWEILDTMIKHGIEPDRYTVSTVVKGMHMTGGSAEELDRAIRMVRTLGPAALANTGSGMVNPRDHNTRLVEVIFNTLLDICCSSRDLDRMTEIFGMMQEFNVETSTVTFGTLIKAFGQAGQLQRCHEVWKKMLGLGLVPTVVTYGCYIDACIRNEDINIAEQIFYQMIERKVRPNAVIYTSIIRGLASAFQPVKAFKLYRRMREDGVEPTSVTFNSVLDMVARQLADSTMLQEVLNDMSKAKSAPDVVTYSILIKASCNAGNLDNALALFNRVRKTGAMFDHVAFNTLLLAFSKADRLQEAEDIFQDMTKLKMMPTSVTTAILVKMYGRAQLPDKAAAVFDFIEYECGEKPDLFAYTCFIEACVQNRQVRRSWEVFDRMLRAGLVPDALAYTTAIHGCLQVCAFDHAMSLIRHAYMWPDSRYYQHASQYYEAWRDADGWLPTNHYFPLHLVELKQPVDLADEVFSSLRQALKRKELPAFIVELDKIMQSRAQSS
mmetsp:Transcript_40062/g.74487  ORF Transcript_40062/g.74487 Transcript_40062/m.74487 type:complete len:901 (+) Transcript_40062:198-2900(+)